MDAAFRYWNIQRTRQCHLQGCSAHNHQPVGDVKAGWKNLESAVKADKVHALGLSNFKMKGAEDIYRWCTDSTEIKTIHPANGMSSIRAAS